MTDFSLFRQLLCDPGRIIAWSHEGPLWK